MIPATLWSVIHDHHLEPGDFASLRFTRSGSDKVSTELLAEFAAAAGFPIVEGYGMTEVGLATLNPVRGDSRQGSIGMPIGGFTRGPGLDEMPLNPTGKIDRVGLKRMAEDHVWAERSGRVTTPAQDRSTMDCMAAG
jgi:long-chain acyl-CoA synthetase